MEDVITKSPFSFFFFLNLEVIGWILFAYQEIKMASDQRIRQGDETLSFVSSCHQHGVLPSGGHWFLSVL